MASDESAKPTIPGLVSHIQAVTEREKAVLARELHDELGGLLVAASMDLGWLDRQIPASAGEGGAVELRRRLDRLRETLAGAVDIKRKIIEGLRPTLLDNVGLFAALRWLVKNTCARARLASTMSLPPHEPHFSPDASIALFRIAQEGLGIILEFNWVDSIELALARSGPTLTLSIKGSGEPTPMAQREAADSYELAAIRHRTIALGGGIAFSTASTGEANLAAWLPLASVQAC